jgi:hypothetical protein
MPMYPGLGYYYMNEPFYFSFGYWNGTVGYNLSTNSVYNYLDQLNNIQENGYLYLSPGYYLRTA